MNAKEDGCREPWFEVSSTDRLRVFLRRTRRMPSAEFMALFVETFPMCDDTWADRHNLLRRLRRHHSPIQGEPLTLYRGCSSGRIRGISWTSDRDVAHRFACGHRGIGVPNAVIVTAEVPATAIFAGRLDERNEAEYLIDPRAVRIIAIERQRSEQ